jgi:curved DNA-binding protein CbpA
VKDFYAILAVARDAPPEVIQAAYRALAKVHHPDKGGNEDVFKAIQEAYATLSDPGRRALYDAQYGYRNGTNHQQHASSPHDRPGAYPGRVWVNGIGWCTPGVSNGQGPGGIPPNYPTGPTPMSYPGMVDEMMRQAASQVGHDMVERVVEELFERIRRGR